MNTPPPFHPHGMPPVPRDHDKASLTEVLPFGSRKIRMTRSPITIFLLMCAVATPLLFSFLIGSFEKYDLVGEQALIQGFIRTSVTAIFLMTVAYCLAIYFYARPGRSIWPFLMAYVFLALIAIVPEVFGFNFIWDAFAYIFRDAVGITVERLQRPDAGFFDQFSGMFVAAGLCEELFKMLPVLFGAALAIAYQRRPGPRSGFVRFFQIRGPLDGALMGVFTGAAFVFWETAFQYVPGKADEIAQLTGDTGTGMYMGFMLLFPRVIGGIVGHSAYSAIFGYFIGLGVLRRRHFIPLFLGGWLTASLIHGLWNSVSAISPNLWYAVAIVSAIFAAAVILKGRQLNQAMGGGDAETMGSILIDRSGTGGGGAAGYGQPAYAGYTPPQPGYGGHAAPFGGGYPPPQPQHAGGYPPQPQPFQGYPPAPAAGSFPPAPTAGGYPPPPQQPFPPQPSLGDMGYPKSPASAPQPAAPPPDLAKAHEPPAPAPPPAPAASPAPAAEEPLKPSWPQFERDLQPQAPTETFAAHVAPPAPSPGGEPPLVLDINGLIIPIRAGAAVDLAAEPALGGRGAGVRAEVVPHPSRPGVLGLRNSGERSWTAHLRDGRVQPIERDQNVRLAPGVRIDFGDGIFASVNERS